MEVGKFHTGFHTLGSSRKSLNIYKNVGQHFLTFVLTFIVGELWFRTDTAKHKQVGFSKKWESKCCECSHTQSPEVVAEHTHTSVIIAAAFPSPWSSGDDPSSKCPHRYQPGASRSQRRRPSSGSGRIGGGAATRPARSRFVFHLEGLFHSSARVIRAEGVGSGELAGGRAAHLLVALLVGVVTRVRRLLTALAGVGALRGKDLLR